MKRSTRNRRNASTSIGFLFVLLVVTGGIIYYAQSTLVEIKRALPVTVLKQERDVALLVQDTLELLRLIQVARLEQSQDDLNKALAQTDVVDNRLREMRRTYNFDNLIGASAIHAVVNPALLDIKNWLTNGIQNFGPNSPFVLRMAETRTRNALNRMRPLFAEARKTAAELLQNESEKIGLFRTGIIGLLVVAAILAGLLVLHVYRLRVTSDALVKAKTDAESANRLKSELLATMSHEFRTPLNAIMGFSDVIRHRQLGSRDMDKYREYANDIHSSGELLLSLINDLLDMSTIEAGKRQLEKEYVHFRAILDDSARSVDILLQRKAIHFSAVVPNDLPELFVDRRSMTQILHNLLSNAIKFTPRDGEIIVEARLDGQRAIVSVSDTGIGIPKDMLRDIANPFVRGQTNPHIASEGTGLGLSIVKSLAEENGGEMYIESEPGIGTTVSVAIPSSSRTSPDVSGATTARQVT